MNNIFINFGSSTKRNDNLQTGGFGIGAKTPWCYTDAFTITTISREPNGWLAKRSYSAIAEGNKFKLLQLGETILIDETDETIPLEDRHTGTIISITVNKDDFQSFSNKTLYFSKFWDVKPELVGVNPVPEYEIYNPILEGLGFKIYKSYANEWASGSPFAIVDGIPYKIDAESLKTKCTDHQTAIILKRTDINIYFKIGELDLSLSREALQYTQKTSDLLIKRASEIAEYIIKSAGEAIKNAPTYLEAHKEFHKYHSSFPVIGNWKSVSWNGIPLLHNGTIGFPYGYSNDDKCVSFRRADYDQHRKRKQFNTWSKESLNLVENDIPVIIIDVDGEINKNRIIHFIESQPNYNQHSRNRCFLLKFSTAPAVAVALDEWKKKNNWDLLKDEFTIFYSKLPDRPRKKREVTSGTTVVSHVVQSYVLQAGDAYFSDVSIDLKTETGYYVEVDRKNVVANSKCNEISIDETCNIKIGKILTALGISKVYGIPTRFLHKVGPNLKPLFSKENLTKCQNCVDSVYTPEFIKFLENNESYDEPVYKVINILTKISNKLDNGHIINKYIESDTNFRNMQKQYTNWSRNTSNIDDMKKVIKDLVVPEIKPKNSMFDVTLDMIYSAYPLFQIVVSQYYSGDTTEHIKELTFYIQKKDEEALKPAP
jgi:hypothetical protein